MNETLMANLWETKHFNWNAMRVSVLTLLSTLNEFQRIWTRFVELLRRHHELNVFVNAEGMPHLPLQIVPCVLFIKHLTLAGRPVHDSDAEFRYLGPGTINNTIAALK